MPNYSIPIKPFPHPTSVTLELPPGQRQDGLRPLPVLPLSALSREDVEALCTEFTNRVMTEYHRQVADAEQVAVANQARLDRGG